jgi:hypothetical protein
MRIIVVGAGDTGMDLARKLGDRENMDLVIIDSDEKRCELASNELNALVLKGDGTDPEILKQAQVSEADVLVALTGSDPLNTVVSMLGRRFDVKKIMVKLNGLALRSACQSSASTRLSPPRSPRRTKSCPPCTATTGWTFPSSPGEGSVSSRSAWARPRGKKSPTSSFRKEPTSWRFSGATTCAYRTEKPALKKTTKCSS